MANVEGYQQTPIPEVKGEDLYVLLQQAHQGL